MVVFLVAGVIAAVLHYELYHYLDTKAVTPGGFFREQSVASIIGNALAHAANSCLAGAISMGYSSCDCVLEMAEHPFDTSTPS